jgi:hypothetical protein
LSPVKRLLHNGDFHCGLDAGQAGLETLARQTERPLSLMMRCPRWPRSMPGMAGGLLQGQRRYGCESGSSLLKRMWTLPGIPCVTIPAGVGPQGLPPGVPIVGADDNDERVLRTAESVRQAPDRG